MSDETRATGRPRFVQDLLERETRPVPEVLRAESQVDLGVADVPRERYLSREYHDLEVERVWRRVWQPACREEQLREVGDHVVYEVADMSYVVVRSAPDRVRAFVNACLHRGTQLRTTAGRSAELRCPFHGFTWSLDGELVRVPMEWDFPQVDRARFSLPEARVDTWGGFVFLNPDPAAPPLSEHLGDLPRHFEPWPLEDRYTTAYVTRELPCNWKVALEAFLESFHTFATHPQLITTSGDTQTQYDVFAGQRWNRMITPVGMASEMLDREVTEEEILRSMFMTRDDASVSVPDGGMARDVLAERVRASLAGRTGRDWSHVTDMEALDAIQYWVFPAFCPWAGHTTPLVYVFRPLDGPDRCVMDVMLLEPMPEGERPRPAPHRVLGPGERFADAPELGFLGRIFDQDVSNMGRIQRGLKASVKPGVTFSRYQESRLRHLHALLTDFVGR